MSISKYMLGQYYSDVLHLTGLVCNAICWLNIGISNSTFCTALTIYYAVTPVNNELSFQPGFI